MPPRVWIIKQPFITQRDTDEKNAGQQSGVNGRNTLIQTLDGTGKLIFFFRFAFLFPSGQLLAS